MTITNFDNHTSSEEVAQTFGSNIKDKVVLVTGCTWGGIGAENARVIAGAGAKLVIIAGRSQTKLDETVANIKKEFPTANIRTLVVDLASLKSVRHAAEEVNNYPENINVLINNAAIMAVPYSKTEDGFESQFGTNHLGPFLFTNLILKKLLATKDPRIVNVTSLGHAFAPIIFEDPGFSDGKKYVKFYGYGQSKTANILFARELSRRYAKEGLVAFSCHPGVIYNTGLAKHLDLDVDLKNLPADYWGNREFSIAIQDAEPKNLSQGGATTLVAAFDPSIASQAGAFLTDCQVREDICRAHAKPLNYAFKLWNMSEEMVGQKFSD